MATTSRAYTWYERKNAAQCKLKEYLLAPGNGPGMPPTVTTCPFCTLPAERSLAGNDLAFAILDGFPVSRGHTLLIPRRHVASFFDLSRAEQESMLTLLAESRKRLEQEFAPDGMNIGINDGRAAGQTVMHVHMHLIPRYIGDVPDPRGGIRWVLPAAADYWSPKD